MTRRQLPDGSRTVLRYAVSSGSPPIAHASDPLGEIHAVVDVVLTQLAGFGFTSSSTELTDALIKAGCPTVRTGHAYSRDLVKSPPEGTAIGPVLSASAHVVHAGRVVALLIVNRMTGTAPYAGPWVSEVCRVPGMQYRGLGSALLRRAMAVLAAAGETSLSLVVTEGNPARETYERLGFTHAGSFRKLQIPATGVTPSRR